MSVAPECVVMISASTLSQMPVAAGELASLSPMIGRAFPSPSPNAADKQHDSEQQKYFALPCKIILHLKSA